MRAALFFLSLSVTLSLYGALGTRLGILLSLIVFSVSVWGMLLRGERGILRFSVLVLIGIILSWGTIGLPFGRRMLVTTTLATILLIFRYSNESKEVDIAPAISVFVAILLFLHTFMYVPIPVRICWDILIFLTSASVIDDWNTRRRGREILESEQCYSE